MNLLSRGLQPPGLWAKIGLMTVFVSEILLHTGISNHFMSVYGYLCAIIEELLFGPLLTQFSDPCSCLHDHI